MRTLGLNIWEVLMKIEEYLQLLSEGKVDEARKVRFSTIPSKLIKFIWLDESEKDEKKFLSLQREEIWFAQKDLLNDPYEYKGILLDRKKLSEAGYSPDVIEKYQTLFDFSDYMLFTLLICFIILIVNDKVSNKFLKDICILGLTVLSLFSDWALLAPIFTLLFIWSRGTRNKIKYTFIISMLLFGLFNFAGGIGRFSLGTNIAYALGSMLGIALAGIVILYFYNGKRMEKGKVFSKWFFYLFYPVHLLILGLIRIYCL